MFQLPNTVCLTHVCVVRVNSETGPQINVTLNEIVSEGIYNPTCKYGGIVAGEYLDNNYEESITICQKHHGQNEQSKSMYSKNSSLVIVLYWYNIYQNIKASLTLSVTRCQSVNIDLCEHNIICSNQFDTTKNLDSLGLCDSFLSRATKWSNIKFSTRESYLSFSMDENQCSIVQFSSRNIKLPKSAFNFRFEVSNFVCHTYFVLGKIFQIEDRRIELIIKGNMEKYFKMADSVELLVQTKWMFTHNNPIIQ